MNNSSEKTVLFYSTYFSHKKAHRHYFILEKHVLLDKIDLPFYFNRARVTTSLHIAAIYK